MGLRTPLGCPDRPERTSGIHGNALRTVALTRTGSPPRPSCDVDFHADSDTDSGHESPASGFDEVAITHPLSVYGDSKDFFHS
jgi:hypothetical protein